MNIKSIRVSIARAPISSVIMALLAITFCAPSFADSIQAFKLNKAKTEHTVKAIPKQWTLVQMWTLDCVICEKQKPDLAKLHSEYDEITVIGLSLDGLNQLDAVKQRVAKSDVSFDNYVSELSDFKKILANDFNTKYAGTPTYILYSPEGEVKAVASRAIDLKNLPASLGL